MRSKQRCHQRQSKTLSVHPILGETADRFFGEQSSAVRHSVVVKHQYQHISLAANCIRSCYSMKDLKPTHPWELTANNRPKPESKVTEQCG